MFVNFVTLVEPKKINDSLDDAELIRAMQYEQHEFKLHNIWNLILHYQGKKIVGTCWLFQNKMDEDDVITRNKHRLVVQGYTKLEGRAYDKTFFLLHDLKPSGSFWLIPLS